MNKIEDAIWYNTQYILQLQNEATTHQTKSDDRLETVDKTVVGGINELNTSINIMLNALDEPPTYTKPTLFITLSNGIATHNKETQIRISPVFNMNDSGGIEDYTLSRDGVQLYNGVPLDYTDTIMLTHGVGATYTAKLSYLDGEIKQTLLGISYPNGRIEAGTLTSTNSVQGCANSYYGVISNDSITDEDITNFYSRLSTTKSFTYTTNLTNQRIVYMYPRDFGKLTSIKDANNFDYINSYTVSTMTYDYVEYYVYILTDEVTITSFKQIFS